MKLCYLLRSHNTSPKLAIMYFICINIFIPYVTNSGRSHVCSYAHSRRSVQDTASESHAHDMAPCVPCSSAGRWARVIDKCTAVTEVCSQKRTTWQPWNFWKQLNCCCSSALKFVADTQIIPPKVMYSLFKYLLKINLPVLTQCCFSYLKLTHVQNVDH